MISRAYTYRGNLNSNPHYTFNKNVVGNFYQVSKRDLRSNLMMTMVEMIWGNLFKLNISNRKEKNKVLGNVITTSKKIIDNIMVNKKYY